MASQTSNLSRKELAIKDLLAEIARALVDHPEGVQVREVEGFPRRRPRIENSSGRFGQSDRAAGTHSGSDSHALGSSRSEIAQAIHT